MKKRITACLLCLLLLPALTLFAAAKSGRLDAAVAAETRAIAVEIESEGTVLLKTRTARTTIPMGETTSGAVTTCSAKRAARLNCSFFRNRSAPTAPPRADSSNKH